MKKDQVRRDTTKVSLLKIGGPYKRLEIETSLVSNVIWAEKRIQHAQTLLPSMLRPTNNWVCHCYHCIFH